MKTYEKPRLVALSLSGNEMLCSCAIDVADPNMNDNIKRQLSGLGWLNAEGTGAIDNVFTEDMTCSLKMDGYCKNTPEGQVVFAS